MSIQNASTKRRPVTSTCPTGISADHLQITVNHLLSNSMALNTFCSYSRTLGLFNQFRNIAQYEYTWPIPVEHIVSYIAYMYQQKLSHSTISCYIAGLGFYSKINNMEDNTQKIVIRKMIEGVKRTTKSQSYTRLPITKVLLGKLLNIFPVVTKNNFELQLFRAVYSLAFYGFLRVGELTTGGKKTIQTMLLRIPKSIQIILSKS